MDPIEIIKRYYDPESKAYAMLVNHSTWVADKSVALAKRIGPGSIDLDFLHEAAMLHDIGIFATNAPGLDCHGDLHYLHHGIEGKKILDADNMPRHGLVCERHVGVGIPKEEAALLNMGLPERDMLPLSREEKIICYVDKFHSKNGHAEGVTKSVDQVARGLAKFGEEKVAIFQQWVKEFGLP